MGNSQSTFGDMLFELGLASSMRPEAEYTLLAPMNKAFTGESPIKLSQNISPPLLSPAAAGVQTLHTTLLRLEKTSGFLGLVMTHRQVLEV